MGFWERLSKTDYSPLENRDFKHVIQETYHVYIGASMTYQEAIENDEVPFKFKAAVHNFVFGEADREGTIREHLMNLKPGDSSMLLFKQIKLKMTVNSVKPDASGRYTHKTIDVNEYVTNPVYSEHRDDWFIEEIVISKLSLLTVG